MSHVAQVKSTSSSSAGIVIDDQNIVRKVGQLYDFKLSDDERGTFSGYVWKFNKIDDVGDIIVPGAFAPHLSDFLTKGFHTDTHDWTFASMFGMPVDAKEDSIGVFFLGEFHTDDKSQDIRLKMRERHSKGKAVLFSMGARFLKVDFIMPSEFEKRLPDFISAAELPEALEKAKKFSRIRVVLDAELNEISSVPVPVFSGAELIDVKDGSPESKREHVLNENTSRWFLMTGLFDLLDTLAMRVSVEAQIGTAEEIAARQEIVRSAFTEAGEIFASAMTLLITDDDDMQTELAARIEEFTAKYEIKHLNPHDGLRFETRQRIALDAVRCRIDDWKAILQTKDDQMELTQSRRDRLQGDIESYESFVDDLKQVLVSSEVSDPNLQGAILEQEFIYKNRSYINE